MSGIAPPPLPAMPGLPGCLSAADWIPDELCTPAEMLAHLRARWAEFVLETAERGLELDDRPYCAQVCRRAVYDASRVVVTEPWLIDLHFSAASAEEVVGWVFGPQGIHAPLPAWADDFDKVHVYVGFRALSPVLGESRTTSIFAYAHRRGACPC